MSRSNSSIQSEVKYHELGLGYHGYASLHARNAIYMICVILLNILKLPIKLNKFVRCMLGINLVLLSTFQQGRKVIGN